MSIQGAFEYWRQITSTTEAPDSRSVDPDRVHPLCRQSPNRHRGIHVLARGPLMARPCRPGPVDLVEPCGEYVLGQHVSRLVDLDAEWKRRALDKLSLGHRVAQFTQSLRTPVAEQQVGGAVRNRPRRLKNIVDEDRDRGLDPRQTRDLCRSGNPGAPGSQIGRSTSGDRVEHRLPWAAIDDRQPPRRHPLRLQQERIARLDYPCCRIMVANLSRHHQDTPLETRSEVCRGRGVDLDGRRSLTSSADSRRLGECVGRADAEVGDSHATPILVHIAAKPSSSAAACTSASNPPSIQSSLMYSG